MTTPRWRVYASMEWHTDGSHDNWNGLNLEIRAATSMSELNDEQQRTNFTLTLLSVPARDKRAAIKIRDCHGGPGRAIVLHD